MQANIGERFNRLTVLADCTRPGERTRRLCRCDCGTEKEVMARHLVSGAIASCGCLSRETTRRIMTKHGASDTPEYVAWQSIQRRCYNPHTADFARYGGRGIVVCDRWRDSFENFLADMGARPSPKHSIDRIDNDGPYSPENCRWATNLEQSRNRRSNRLIEYEGETLCLHDWATRYGLTFGALRARLEHGWTIEAALTTPADDSPLRVVEYRGEALPISAWAARCGMSAEALYGRLRTGWTVEDALTTPLLRRGQRKAAGVS